MKSKDKVYQIRGKWSIYYTLNVSAESFEKARDKICDNWLLTEYCGQPSHLWAGRIPDGGTRHRVGGRGTRGVPGAHWKLMDPEELGMEGNVRERLDLRGRVDL